MSYNNFEAIRFIQEEIEHHRAPMDSDSFEFSLELYNDSSLKMLMHGLFEDTLILGKDSISGEFKDGSEEKLIISEDRYLYETFLDEIIDFEVLHKKPFKCVTSRVDMSFVPGSTGSLHFLNLIQEADDDILFRSDLQFFIDYKWEK